MRCIALLLRFPVFLAILAQGYDEKERKIERVWSQDYTKRKGVWFHCKKYPNEHEQCLLSAWDHKFRTINDPKSPVQITYAKLYNIGKARYSAEMMSKRGCGTRDRKEKEKDMRKQEKGILRL